MVASAEVNLNGKPVFRPKDLRKGAPFLVREAMLEQGDNRLEITLRGKPGGLLVISIVREVGVIDEAEAIELVRDVILPREVPLTGAFSAMLIPGELPAGTPIYEGGPMPAGAVIGAPNAAPGSVNSLPVPALIAAEDSFFFFLDLAPHTFYEHPVEYILVGKSGEYQIAEADWWPVVNGRMPAELIPRNPDPNLIVAERDVSRLAPAETELDYILPVCVPCIVDLIQLEGFIVVQGLLPTENLIAEANLTHVNGVFFFGSYINTYLGFRGRMRGLLGVDADEVLNEIDAMAAEGRSVITLYIIAHGGTDSISLGGFSFSAQHFRNKFAQYPDIQFNFLLGSCNSGSFIDDLQSLPNVAVVGTAVANGEGATPDWDDKEGVPWDLNIHDFGSEWTSSVLAAGRDLLADPARAQAVFSLAALEEVPGTSMLLDQSPRGATGDNEPFGLVRNLDLSNRLSNLNAATYGGHNPQIYRSWP